MPRKKIFLNKPVFYCQQIKNNSSPTKRLQIFPSRHLFILPILNKDGKEEIFILFGNTYTSGNTGSSIMVFIKNTSNQYKMNLGFPSTLPDAITSSSTAYPDLVIGGPGFEFPIWKWKAGEYVFSKSIKEKDLEKLKTESIETISKKYTDQIK